MTRALVTAVHEAKLSFGVAVIAYLLVALALPFTLVVDAISALGRSRRHRRVLGARSTACPRGHVVGLVGAFTCPACGLASAELHAFAACPHCGSFAAAISCPCGLVVRNPLWTPEVPS